MESLHGIFDNRFALKGSGPVYAPDRTFDTEHVRLDLKIDLNKQVLKGHCQVTLKAITDEARSMTFDAVNFVIEKIKWNGDKIGFVYKKGKLTVKSKRPVQEGEKVQVDIYYRVIKPKMGLYFLKPDRHYPDKPTQAWTQGQDEYARYWFPCLDHAWTTHVH